MGKRQGLVEVPCVQCGAVWLVKPSGVARGEGRYCSIGCYNAARCLPVSGTRACRRCGDEKPVDSFPQRAGRPDGQRHSYCVTCMGAVGKPSRERYARTDKGRAAQHRSDARQRAKPDAPAKLRAKWEATRDSGRAAEIRSAWVAANRDHYLTAHAARMRVHHAIRRGQLVRPESCGCGGGPVEAHHHNGYAPEHALDVLWLCRRCHEAAERSATEVTRTPATA